MVGLGIGEVVGGQCMGLVNDWIGNRRTSLVNVFLVFLCFACTCYNISVLNFDWTTYLMCFLWGLQDSAANIHCASLMSFQFVSQSEPFGVFNLFQGFSLFIFEFIQTMVDEDPNRYLSYTVAVGILGMIATGTTYWFPYIVDGEEKDDLNNSRFERAAS